MAKKESKDPKEPKAAKERKAAKDSKDAAEKPAPPAAEKSAPRLVKKPGAKAAPAPQPVPAPAPAAQAAPKPAPQAAPKPKPPAAPKPAPQAAPKPGPQAAPTPAPQAAPTPAPQAAPKPRPGAEPKPRAPRKQGTLSTDRTPGTAGTASTSTVSTDRTPSTLSTVSTTRSPKSRPGDALEILMVTPEARPFAKTGGLADVCGALPLALARLGHRVTLVLPKYRQTQTDGAAGEAGQVPFGLHSYPVRFIEQRVAEGVTAVLIDAPALFDRDGLYGDHNGEFGDNAFRFAVLSRGALEYARLRGRRLSVIHAHDWQTGLVPVYAHTALRDDPIVGNVRTVLTIHNLAFQGGFDSKEMNWIGLGPDLYTPQLLEFYGRASTLKGGIVFSDAITTVSPNYAREIVTPEYGFSFDGILRSRAADLTGIVNGIDTEVWDPRSDPNLPTTFDPDTLERKQKSKRALLDYVGLPADEAAMARPLMGIVTRLTHQKGCDLFATAAERLMAFDATWIMLGSGDAWCEDLWRGLAARFPERVAARIGFDDRLAHLIEGGSDMFVMPSWYEPCGLNQMYSLRYGTVPIVRATGGLEDTVVDSDESSNGATGFKFRHYTAEGLLWAIDRAISLFRGDPAQWRAMQRRGMGRDFSWDVSAREYVKVYRG